MHFSYNNGVNTSLAHDARTWLRNLDLPELYRAMHLFGKVRARSIEVALPGRLSVKFDSWAAALNTPTGLLARRDLLQYKTDDGDQVGQALGASALNHVAFVTPLRLEPSGAWRKIEDVGSVPYFEFDHQFYVLLHL